VKRLMILATVPILVTGCGLSTDRDVRAYNTCLSRHPQDAVVCEGPRQAYELEPSFFEARSVANPPVAVQDYDGGWALFNRSAPVPLHPDPMPAGAGSKG
jgi:hypothetical protein